MNDPTALPLALYQANLALQTRLGELVQAGGRHWLEFGQRLVNDGLVENNIELQEILRTLDWQKLAALPADAFWRQMQQRFGDQQAAAQLTVAAQSAFAHELQDALGAWQRDTIAALDDAGFGLAAPVVSSDWTVLFGGPSAAQATTAKSSPPRETASKKAPAKKATARKAPSAKKATARAAKPAAKKTAKAAAAKPAKKAVAKKAAARKRVAR